MTLPKMNEVSKYRLTIPSTKQEVTYRPFYVKEQKTLLIAMETGEEDDLINAIIDTIDACMIENINVHKLPTFDIEYIFTQIRAKSIGEESELIMGCGECGTHNDVIIKLEDIKIALNSYNNEINLSDQFKIILRYPTYKDLKVINEGKTETEKLFNTIIICLDKLVTEDEIINFIDETREDKEEFLNNLTPKQFAEVTKFIQNMPALEYNSEFICKNCETVNKYNVKGLRDFF